MCGPARIARDVCPLCGRKLGALLGTHRPTNTRLLGAFCRHCAPLPSIGRSQSRTVCLYTVGLIKRSPRSPSSPDAPASCDGSGRDAVGMEFTLQHMAVDPDFLASRFPGPRERWGWRGTRGFAGTQNETKLT